MNAQERGVTARLSSYARGLIVVSFVGLSGLTSSAALAQDFAFGSIRVEGNTQIESANILGIGGIAAGRSYSAAELNAAAQAIRESGLFESVDAIPSGGTLIIRVVEYPIINRINFEGNRVLSDAELFRLIASQQRRVYSPSQAEADVQALVDAYAAKGRINAMVTPKIIRRSESRVDLVFEIDESTETEVERISFIGNRSYSDRRLRRVLETKQAGFLRALIGSDTFVEDRLEFDKQVLTDFYQSRGFADFEILSADATLTNERDGFLMTFAVQEGRQFRFGDVSVVSEIEGVDAAAYEAALRFREGAAYTPVMIDTNIARLEQLALREGVSFLQVEPRVTRNDRALTLDVEFALVRGPRVFVERIDISGNTSTLDRVVRSQFRVVEGDPFNPRLIRQSAERIRALGFFSDSSVQTRAGSASDQVIIDVDVTEAPTGSFTFGGSYNTDVGFGLLAEFSERNFLGRGQQLDFRISTALTNRRFNLSFTEPYLLGRDLGFGLDTSYTTTDNENADFDTTEFRFSPSISFPVSEDARLKLYYGLNYGNITDVSASASDFLKADRDLGGIWTNSLGYNFNWDNRLTGLNPSGGVVLRFGQELGVGSTSFLKTTALAGIEQSVLSEEVTLRASVEGGHLAYFTGRSRIIDRFSLNSNTMRGFEPGGIGPRDTATGDALGGETYAVASAEAEFPLGLPEEFGIKGGAFVDYGALWNTGLGAGVEYDAFTPRSVAGVSVFWDTPIGPLRFNWTQPLQTEANDQTRNFDITISTSF